MKLYFYIMDGYKNKLACVTAEATERPKTYRLQEGVPSLYREVIYKDEIGITLGWNSNIVVLTEKNTTKAKEIFINRIREEINKHRKEIERYEKEIDTINSL